MKRTTISLLFLLFIVVNALAEVINITIKGTTDKASKEVIVFLNGSNSDIKPISVNDGCFEYSDKVEKYSFIYFVDKKAKIQALTIADAENITLDMLKTEVSGSALTEKMLTIHSVLTMHDSLRTEYRKQAFNEKDLLLRKELRQKAQTEKRLFDECLVKAIEENKDNCLATYFVAGYMRNMDYNLLKSYIASDAPYTKHPLFENAIGWAESNQPSYDLVGKKFIDFADIDNNGIEHRLSEYAGKSNYVVLDFWASWCTPCIAEMPKLKTAQELYGDKGLQIVGVSLDGNERKWKEAIEKHSLSWTHLGNKEGQRQYHVRAIPKLILINGEGIIEAVDLRSDDLLEKLQDIYEPM